MLNEGSNIGSYRILRLVGRGGMGEVYEAEPLSGGADAEHVALKVVRQDRADGGDLARRLINEARLIQGIDHPNILPVHSVEEVDGVPLVAMRLVDGIDLMELLGGVGALDWHEAFELLAPVASALEAAHATGVIHRDVKPANVLLEQIQPGRYHPYLTDFGIALMHNDDRYTDPAVTLGTFDYLSPEQITEGAARADGRADTYAFGCLLYRAIVGRTPFSDTQGPATLFAHVNTPAPRISASRTEIPPAVDDFVARCLSKDPEARPKQLSGEMRSLLLENDDSGETIAAPMSTPQPSATRANTQDSAGAPPHARGRRRVIAAAAAVATMAVVAAIALTVLGGGGNDTRAATASSEATARTIKVSGADMLVAQRAQCAIVIADHMSSALSIYKQRHGTLDGASLSALHKIDGLVPARDPASDDVPAPPGCDGLSLAHEGFNGDGSCPSSGDAATACFEVSVDGAGIAGRQSFVVDLSGDEPAHTCDTADSRFCDDGGWDPAEDAAAIAFQVPKPVKSETILCVDHVVAAMAEAIRALERPATRKEMSAVEPTVLENACGGARLYVGKRRANACSRFGTDVAGTCVGAQIDTLPGGQITRAIWVDLSDPSGGGDQYHCTPVAQCPETGQKWFS